MSHEQGTLERNSEDDIPHEEVRRLLKEDIRIVTPERQHELVQVFRAFREMFPEAVEPFAAQAERLLQRMKRPDRKQLVFLCLYAVIHVAIEQMQRVQTNTRTITVEQLQWLVEVKRVRDAFIEALFLDQTPGEPLEASDAEPIPRRAEWLGADLTVTAMSYDKNRKYSLGAKSVYGRNEDAYVLPGELPQWEALCRRLEVDEYLPGLSDALQELFSQDPDLQAYLLEQEIPQRREARVFGAFDGIGGCSFSELVSWLVSRVVHAHAQEWDALRTRSQIYRAMEQAIDHADALIERLREVIKPLEETRARTRGVYPRSLTYLGTTACVAYQHPLWPGRIFGINLADSEAFLWKKGHRELVLLSTPTTSFVGAHANDHSPALTHFEALVEPGDVLSLASDGLTKLFPFEELARLHQKYDEEGIVPPFSEWILRKSTLSESFYEAPLTADGRKRTYGIDDVTVVSARWKEAIATEEDLEKLVF